MKVLSSSLSVPKWQKSDRLESAPTSGPVRVTSIEQGHPLSMLPLDIQDALREGKPIDIPAGVSSPSKHRG